MNVVFTGQSGIKKDEIIKNLASEIRRRCGYEQADPENQDKEFIKFYKVEDYFAYTPMAFKAWLEIPNQHAQMDHWANGLRDLNDEIENDTPENAFISLHCVYYKYGKYFAPAEWNLLRGFHPDLFITLIDDIFDIKWRLHQDQYELPQTEEFKLRELLDWRSVEIMSTENLARNLYPGRPIPHYVIAVKHPVEIACKLILDPECMRIYAAYPITDARKDPGMMSEIDEHRKEMHQRFVTFDPITIDEYSLVDILEEYTEKGKNNPRIFFNRKTNSWFPRSESCDLPLLCDCNLYSEEFEIDVDEIREAEMGMSHQIRWRDFKLLDQSQVMAAYRPNYAGGSLGVNKELLYAELTGVPVCIFWPGDDGEPRTPFRTSGTNSTDYCTFLEDLSRHEAVVRNYADRKNHQGMIVGCKPIDD